MRKLILIVISTILILPSISLAHGGGLDKCGGHRNRKTGGYHYHRGPYPGCPGYKGTTTQSESSYKTRDDLLKDVQSLKGRVKILEEQLEKCRNR